MRMVICCAFMAASAIALCADTPAKKDEPAVNDKAFHEALLKAAKDYKTFGRVDDVMRWAPTLCMDPGPSKARFSASKDAETHGGKLYFLFAKKRAAYVAAEDQAGQVIVKEGWVAKEVPADTQARQVVVQVKEEVILKKGADDGPPGAFDRYLPYAKKDGKLFHADSLASLFIMLKLDPKTENTDEGWVYGTVSADGKTVTSAGKVASCMSCHTEAKKDRLFGLTKEARQ